MDIRYLDYVNCPAADFTSEKERQFFELLASDERVLSFSKMGTDVRGRKMIRIRIENEASKIVSYGAAANLLYKSVAECLKSAANNKLREENLIREAKEEAAHQKAEVLLEIKEGNTTPAAIIYVINCLKTGRRMKISELRENALGVIERNQNKGGNWFRYTDALCT